MHCTVYCTCTVERAALLQLAACIRTVYTVQRAHAHLYIHPIISFTCDQSHSVSTSSYRHWLTLFVKWVNWLTKQSIDSSGHTPRGSIYPGNSARTHHTCVRLTGIAYWTQLGMSLARSVSIDPFRTQKSFVCTWKCGKITVSAHAKSVFKICFYCD